MNESPHTTLEPTTTTILAHSFLTELAEKHDGDDVPRTAVQFSWARKTASLATAVFLIDGSHSVQDACHRHGFGFRYEQHGNRNSVERDFREAKRHTPSFSNCFSNADAETADEWLRSFAVAWKQRI